MTPRPASPGSSSTLLGARDKHVQRPKARRAGWTDVDIRGVDTIRVLAADAVQHAGNGHPGAAISLAPAAYLLFQQVMRHDPSDPAWLGRDRFVLSCGHSSLTLYLQLFFGGYGLELADIQALRTWGSRTPGHPELGHPAGVEITTGPLGTGLASAVGMAMAQRRVRGLFDPDAKPGESIFDHHVYVLASDGDIMEGVAHEASSLAGHQELGNLTVIYDQNKISIEDDTDIAVSEDVAARYAAYGWDVRTVDWRGPTADGASYVEDVDALLKAIETGRKVRRKPTLIVLRTIIAWPCPTKQDSGASHGAALGAEEIRGLKTALGFDPEVAFPVEKRVLTHARRVVKRGKAARKAWDKQYAGWRATHPDRAETLDRLVAGQLPADFEAVLPVWEPDTDGIATRAASGKTLTALAPVLPELWGGSADLADSNNTTMAGEPSFIPKGKQTRTWKGHPYGRTLHFGVREFGMGAILNGIAADGLTRPYGGTFLVFSDFMRGAIRLAALQTLPVTFVWTHDSIGVGEDGPTHQPVEHLLSLRAIPDLDVVRPADANETVHAWATILRNRRPAALVLTRQTLPVIDRARHAPADRTARGGYVLVDGGPDRMGAPQVLLVATGSEVTIALAARELLEGEGIATRVVSMPCLEWFQAQDADYREQVLPTAIRARVVVEAGVTAGWHGLAGDAGRVVGLDHFGASADGSRLFHEFGITADAVVAAARASLADAGA